MRELHKRKQVIQPAQIIIIATAHSIMALLKASIAQNAPANKIVKMVLSIYLLINTPEALITFTVLYAPNDVTIRITRRGRTRRHILPEIQ